MTTVVKPAARIANPSLARASGLPSEIEMRSQHSVSEPISRPGANKPTTGADEISQLIEDAKRATAGAEASP
jgi:hypothetical protein